MRFCSQCYRIEAKAVILSKTPSLIRNESFIMNLFDEFEEESPTFDNCSNFICNKKQQVPSKLQRAIETKCTADKISPSCNNQEQPKIEQPRALFLKGDRPEGPIRTKQQEQPMLQQLMPA